MRTRSKKKLYSIAPWWGAAPAGGGGGTPPLDGLSPTGAWSASRKLLTAYGGAFISATGGLTDTVYDQSGNARNLTAAGTARPTAQTAGANSIMALLFNGTTNSLQNASNMNALITTTAGYMIASIRVTAFTVNTTTGFSGAPIIQDNGANAGMHIAGTGSSGKYYADTWDGGQRQVEQTISTAATYVVEWRHESGALTSRLNGAGEQTTAAATTAAMGTVFVGGKTVVHSGHIFELATFQTVPALAQRNALVQAFGTYVGAAV